MNVYHSSTPAGLMRERQAVLRQRYLDQPDKAMVIDYACTDSHHARANDALHNSVCIDRHNSVDLAGGVHTAVGGDSDAPTPGDILCGAIAACFDSTMRIVTNNLGIALTALRVEVTGQVDVRGTLMIDPAVPVGFQCFDIAVRMEGAAPLTGKQKNMLLRATERSCIIMQSLRGNPTISFAVSLAE